ncbi:MAG: hypothetical protein MRY57_01700 [Candidatus Pacebacteria bacterium]|nr:hypothetical protein [Candidatus Paceibacterota bacterium]
MKITEIFEVLEKKPLTSEINSVYLTLTGETKREWMVELWALEKGGDVIPFELEEGNRSLFSYSAEATSNDNFLKLYTEKYNYLVSSRNFEVILKTTDSIEELTIEENENSFIIENESNQIILKNKESICFLFI